MNANAIAVQSMLGKERQRRDSKYVEASVKIESYDTKSYTPLTQEVIPDPACRAPEAWTSTRVLAFCFHCLLFPFVEIGCVFGLDEVPVRIP